MKMRYELEHGVGVTIPRDFLRRAFAGSSGIPSPLFLFNDHPRLGSYGNERLPVNPMHSLYEGFRSQDTSRHLWIRTAFKAPFASDLDAEDYLKQELVPHGVPGCLVYSLFDGDIFWVKVAVTRMLLLQRAELLPAGIIPVRDPEIITLARV